MRKKKIRVGAKGPEKQYRKIRLGLARALNNYEAWKSGRKVPQRLIGYLMTLEEKNAISIYTDNILPAAHLNNEPEYGLLESKAVLFFFRGHGIEQIALMPIMKEARISRHRLREWLYGSRRRDGLISAMMRHITAPARYCAVCMHMRKPGQAPSYSPRLTGRACTCNSGK